MYQGEWEHQGINRKQIRDEKSKKNRSSSKTFIMKEIVNEQINTYFFRN